MPGIGASNKDAADRVFGAMPKSAFTLLKETRILAEQGRENSAGHVVFDGAIAESCSQPLAVALSPLSVAGFAVFRLAYAGQSRVPGDLYVVERAAGHYLEFLPDRERRYLAGILQRQEVWQSIEKSVVRRAFIFVRSLLALGVL